MCFMGEYIISALIKMLNVDFIAIFPIAQLAFIPTLQLVKLRRARFYRVVVAIALIGAFSTFNHRCFDLN